MHLLSRSQRSSPFRPSFEPRRAGSVEKVPLFRISEYFEFSPFETGLSLENGFKVPFISIFHLGKWAERGAGVSDLNELPFLTSIFEVLPAAAGVTLRFSYGVWGLHAEVSLFRASANALSRRAIF